MAGKLLVLDNYDSFTFNLVHLLRELGVEQLDVTARRARRLEGVVGGGQIGAQERLVGVAMHEPEVLVGGDVGEVPHERAHQRVDLALEVGVADRCRERERALARARQRLEDLCGLLGCPRGHGHDGGWSAQTRETLHVGLGRPEKSSSHLLA